jgi:hypothetical protein
MLKSWLPSEQLLSGKQNYVLLLRNMSRPIFGLITIAHSTHEVISINRHQRAQVVAGHLLLVIHGLITQLEQIVCPGASFDSILEFRS